MRNFFYGKMFSLSVISVFMPECILKIDLPMFSKLWPFHLLPWKRGDGRKKSVYFLSIFSTDWAEKTAKKSYQEARSPFKTSEKPIVK